MEDITTFKTPEKSFSDRRTYRCFRINKNKLTCIVISDPVTEMSGAAMNVNIGSWADPVEVQGLAHFLEHMLFLGNDIYPEENNYSKYVQQHGGFTNAFTASENTNFHFSVASDHLLEALNRFAPFFICPTFTESGTEREMNAVDSEFQKNLNTDVWRLRSMISLTTNPEHPSSKFSTGNLKTLKESPQQKGINIRQELINFYEKYYSPERMYLCVLGRESLDQLTEAVVKSFSAIPPRPLTPPQTFPPPFSSKKCVWHNVRPIADGHSLRMFFSIPSVSKYYKDSPEKYLAHLVGHESEGSLLDGLKNRGWANQLVAGIGAAASDYDTFEISLTLTDEGTEHTDEVIGLAFAYLNLLRESGPQEWIFEEIKTLSNLDWRFIESPSAEKAAIILSGQICEYLKFTEEEVLSAPYLLKSYNPKLIQDTLNLLTPENALIFYVSKTVNVDQKEKHYGVEYSKRDLPKELIEKWKSSKSSDFHLPNKNEFIATDFQLVSQNIKEHIPFEPRAIIDTPLAKLWHKPDIVFGKPRTHALFCLLAPEVYSSPRHACLTSCFIQLCNDALNAYTYHAEVAGLSFAVNHTLDGIEIEFGGYSQKLALLVKKVITTMRTLKVDPNRFKVIKEQQKRSLENVKISQPYMFGQMTLNCIVLEKLWTWKQKLEALAGIEASDVQNFIEILFSRVKIHSLCMGNISENEAKELLNIFQQNISVNHPLNPNEIVMNRCIQLTRGTEYIFQCDTLNTQDPNSVCWMMFEIGKESIKNSVMTELMNQVINQYFYEELRTKQQLGYLVFTTPRTIAKVNSFHTIIQSPNSTPQELSSKIEQFLQDFQEVLSSLDEKEFERHRQGLRAQKEKPFLKVAEEVGYFWPEITLWTFRFKKREEFVQELMTVSKLDLENFYYELICNAKTRKKLTLEIFGSNCPLEEAKKNDPQHNQVTLHSGDELTFKLGMPLYSAL